MNRAQARSLIGQTFTQAFDKTRFRTFVLNLLNRIDESKAGQWNTTYIKDAFKRHVRRYERLGTYTSPIGEKVDVLIVYLTQDSKLERTRTAVRNFVADHLKTRDEKDAALVAFVSPSEQQWRFSYVKMEYAAVENGSGRVGVETRLTPARRFSYIVGEGESCHTAQARLLDMLENTETNPALSDIEEAFSVEAVTKEFFTKYAELFEAIHKALRRLAARDKATRDEFESKAVDTVEFSKKLMGQIVFLYFLQKKGWLGVAKGGNWGEGPRDFLRKLADGKLGRYANFFNDILEPLFYDTLATDRGHEAWCSRFNCRIPFLNGGLFEPSGEYNWRRVDILLPNALFTNNEHVDEGVAGTGVLDVLDRYNFTVNEAEPLEKEVAIDPEMLGKVFENLIEENRRKGLGAYYTPREVVHYMCQESLINYLDNAINTREASLTPVEGTQARLFGASNPGQMALKAPGHEGFVSRADIETFVRLGEQISHYEAVETKYRIRMPKSIEQHAKLIDHELAGITVCDPAVGSGAFPVGMMTEIVRARLALTPYFNDIHERTAYAFKRHAIQNCLYGTDIDPGAVDIAKLRLWLSLVVDEEETTQIKPLPNLDYRVVQGNSLLGFPFKSQRVQEIENLKTAFFDEVDHAAKAQLKKQIDRKLGESVAASTKSLGYEVTFDFGMYFSEVFNRKGGFDIVIANPPYIPIEEITTEDRARFQARFAELQRKFDSAAVFILASLALLNQQGILTFISSVTWQTGENYGQLRRRIMTTAGIDTLVNLPFDVFAAAYVDTGIYILRKRRTTTYRLCVLPKKASLEELARPRYVDVALDLVQPPNYKLVLNPTAARLLEKIRRRPDVTTLGEITESTQGLAASAYSQHRKPLSPFHLPFAPKAQVHRYRLTLNETTFADMATHKSLMRFYEARSKLLVRRIINRQDRIDAAHCEEAAVFKKDINPFVITREDLDVRYLLALINSSLISWLYVNTSAIATKDDFRQTTLAELRDLPIVLPSRETTKAVSRLLRLVDRIVAQKSMDGEVDTAEIEGEVDREVYELYGVSPEEITLMATSQA